MVWSSYYWYILLWTQINGILCTKRSTIRYNYSNVKKIIDLLCFFVITSRLDQKQRIVAFINRHTSFNFEFSPPQASATSRPRLELSPRAYAARNQLGAPNAFWRRHKPPLGPITAESRCRAALGLIVTGTQCREPPSSRMLDQNKYHSFI